MKFYPTQIVKAATSALVAACVCVSTPALADVKLPAIFGDHMVLQRDAAVPVWGWAEAGETVTITAGAATATATATADGKWSAKLNSLATSAEPITLTVAGKNKIEINDVLVGDVWLCSGQSNMGWSVAGAQNAAEVLPKSKDDQLRLFMVDNPLSFEPTADCKGKWALCNPNSVAAFSAVGYFFGRDLREHLKIPIGLVESSIGGSSTQSWTSREALDANPALKKMMDQFRHDEQSLREKLATYYTVTVPQWQKDDTDWRKEVLPAYNAELAKWNDAVKQAKAAGQAEPAKPQPSKPHPGLGAPPDRLTPATCYNGLIVPILPFAMKGVVWFQGEHNTFDPKTYADEFPTMIRDWRARWGQGDFPFIYGQIADNAPQKNGGIAIGNWPLTREVQMKLAEPNVGMAVSVDVGNPEDVHFRNKQPVGQRLALAARHVAYGEDLAWSGPIYDHVDTSAGQAVVHFKFVDNGLITGTAPTDSPFAAASASPLVGFEIAGADKKFVPADATIAGGTVIVKSDKVAEPVAVRYGWSDGPAVNLYNKEGLPASPFRTDSWEK